ncbi:DMT family transporter [Mesobacterium pallidum]|uniref:DMT family transporter n=1 Tax=Mesobacterium pallidum TaxID=2872037 RepID=UPI001EE2E0F6|nr:DMT family transporter [Mesobacterium pallidum]
MSDRRWLWGILALLGAGWGLTTPLTKIAVSGGHAVLGLVFWQLVISVLLLGALTYGRGKRLDLGRQHLALYLMIALLGTVLPNSASYMAARHLPAGIMSIVISMVPLFAFPVALALRQDRFSLPRLVGLALGLAGVALIAAPEASLPERAMLAFLPVALIAPFFYALEGNLVALRGTGGLDPVQVLFGASLVGLAIVAPLVLVSGAQVSLARPWGPDDRALVASSAIHGLVYAGYVWLVGRAGAVFAAQVAYLVTGFGVLWAMLILGERYALTVWLALGVMLTGVALVQPRAGEDPPGPAETLA